MATSFAVSLVRTLHVEMILSPNNKLGKYSVYLICPP